jgi:hypothetical protein
METLNVINLALECAKNKNKSMLYFPEIVRNGPELQCYYNKVYLTDSENLCISVYNLVDEEIKYRKYDNCDNLITQLDDDKIRVYFETELIITQKYSQNKVTIKELVNFLNQKIIEIHKHKKM